ncbi:MAG: hypothetical protein AAGC85_14695 [Bacteroidota bacterium]
MKFVKIVVLFIVVLNPLQVISQTEEIWKAHDGFKSVFQSLRSGEFSGTVNGILFLQKENKSELILDFQGGKAELIIEEDEHEVYDVSTKIYSGFTTSGKTEIKYKTYSSANAISVEVDGEWFEFSLIDGACDMAINGMEFLYKAEAATEYLILRISRELVLNNYRYLYYTFKGQNYESKKKSIRLLPESTLVFAIKR